MQVKPVQLIEASALPDYPADLIDARMTSDYFTVFWHDRWLASETHLKAPMDVQGAALNLFSTFDPDLVEIRSAIIGLGDALDRVTKGALE